VVCGAIGDGESRSDREGEGVYCAEMERRSALAAERGGLFCVRSKVLLEGEEVVLLGRRW
jgi:hypothetical protein